MPAFPVQAMVRGGSLGGRSETTGIGFVKVVGFKSALKERWSYRCTEWRYFFIPSLTLDIAFQFTI